MTESKKERTFSFKLVPYIATEEDSIQYIRQANIDVHLELTDTEAGPVLSITANMTDTDDPHIMAIGGQILDDIKKLTGLYEADRLFVELYTLHHLYHRNDFCAGTPAQARACELAFPHKPFDAARNKKYLQGIGLDPDPAYITPDGKCAEYEAGWYYKPIPPADLARIEELIGE